MTKLFAARLLERVIVTFGLALLATYGSTLLGGTVPALADVQGLSLGHKTLFAAVAAVAQLVVSTLLAPHLGDPDSPDLIPAFVLRRLEAIEPDVAKVAEVADPAAAPEIASGERLLTSMGKSNVAK